MVTPDPETARAIVEAAHHAWNSGDFEGMLANYTEDVTYVSNTGPNGESMTLRGKAEMQPTMKILEMTVGTFRRVCFGFTAVVLAPVVEEILFRGVLYPAIKQRGYPRCALFGTSLLFAAIHGSLMTLVPLFFLAAVFVWLYERTGTLAAPIAAHSFFNTVNFFIFIYRTELEELLKHLRERI